MLPTTDFLSQDTSRLKIKCLSHNSNGSHSSVSCLSEANSLESFLLTKSFMGH